MNLLINNDHRDWSDVEWVQEFFDFLTGTVPEGITIPKHEQIKLTPKKAACIIWYLQQKMPIIPDNITKCDNPSCNNIFDSWAQGFYVEKTGKSYCDSGCVPRYIKENEYE